MSENDYFQQSQKEPPHSISAEQSVIGGLILDDSKWSVAVQYVSESDFYHKDHKLIFSVIRQLTEKQEPVDIITLSDAMNVTGEKNITGWMPYLGMLARDTPSAENIAAYAAIVRDRSILRQMIGAYQSIIEKSLNPVDRSTKDILIEASAKSSEFSALLDDINGGGFVHIKNVLGLAVDRVENVFENGSEISGLETPWLDFNKEFGGLPVGMTIIGGRPKMGKSTISQNIIEHYGIKNNENPIVVFTLEMSAIDFALRMVASVGRIDIGKLISAKLVDEDWARLTSAISLLASSNIYFDDSSYLSTAMYSARLDKFSKDHGSPALVVVDYLQLMDVPACKGNRFGIVSEISRTLTLSAKQYQCRVLALSQLSRSLESRTEKRPNMADLRESGQIEQDASMVIFVYRDEVYNDDSPDKGIAELITAGNRNGKTGTTRLAAILEYCRFENHASAHYAESDYN
jgi:replicative DNA helicase